MKTTYTTSALTAPAASRYMTTHFDAIVSPSLLRNVVTAYNAVDRNDVVARTYAVKYALAAAITAGATLAWHVRRRSLPPAVSGIDRSRWLALKHRVHVWLHRKLRSDDGLRREVEDAKRKLEEYSAQRTASTGSGSKTEKMVEEGQTGIGLKEVQATTQRASGEEGRHVAQAAEQEAFHLKTQLDFSKEELESAQIEIEAFKQEALSLNTKLQEAQQEAKEAKEEVVSIKKKLDQANQNTKTAEQGLEAVSKLLPDVRAEIATLNSQLEASREEEEKATRDISLLERELGETRLEHSKQIASLQEQLQSLRQPVEDNNPIAEEEDVGDALLSELYEEKAYLEERFREEAARCRDLEEEVSKLQRQMLYLRSKYEDDEGRLETTATDPQAPEALPPPTSFTSSGTQTIPLPGSLETSPSPSLRSDHKLHSSQQVLSIAGGIIPSTPPHNDSPAGRATPLIRSPATPDKTLDSVAIAYLYRDGKIDLSGYVQGLAALPPRSGKRKPDGNGETRRPVKKVRVGVLTSGGGPAVRLAKEVSVDKADDGVVPDRSKTSKASEDERIEGPAIGLDEASPSVLRRQGAVQVDGGLRTDMPPISMRTGTKRKLAAGDDKGALKPSQALRIRENLGDEQTPSLDKLIVKSVTETASPTMNTPLPSGGPSVELSVLGSPAKMDDNTTNETVQMNDVESSHSKGATATIENEDLDPDVQPPSIEPAEPNNNTIIPDGNDPEVSTSARPTRPALSQTSRPKSHAPKPAPASVRKSARNANKPVSSLNE
ncbi:hypothetical protein ACET3X_006312 [Alternaria dauci]|uniref:Uncharacterized protein n=1 Tax=Alternaria dauci TaxID=48095 RepID=A0ABR3UHX8_9PLEO